MNKILLIIVVASLANCKTENVYLTVYPVQRVAEITDTVYVAKPNRFRKDFQKADSVFKVASEKAIKSSFFKTKYLRKNNVFN